MTRYIKSFTNTAETHAAVDEGTLGRPYVAYIEDEHRIDWNGYAPKPDYSKEYLTIEALSAGTLNVYHNTGTTQSGTLFYKVNNGEYWVAVPMSSTAEPSESITLSAGDKVIFKGTLEKSNYLFNHNSLPMNVYGNIQSLYFEDDFSGETTCKSAQMLFNICSGLTDASNLVLPATTLVASCYNAMFQDCKGLTSAPALPATTLTPYCYMAMFNGCRSLTTAPELPATTLVQGCYYYMFQGCTSLNSITCLATNISANSCTYDWVSGVAATGTFTKNPAMSSWTTGTSGIPDGWTVVDAS